MTSPHAQWILASGSPRRTQLLSQAGIPHQVMVPDVDESLIPGESPQKMVERLSKEKAGAVLKMIPQKGEFWVLAADTTVVHRPSNKIFGKPENPAEGLRMVGKIAGQTHWVWTGYTLLRVRDQKIVKQKTKKVKTAVTLRSLKRSQISAYVRSGDGEGKAGGYAAQGLGAALIDKIQGSYTNVVGLPISHVIETAEDMGFRGFLG